MQNGPPLSDVIIFLLHTASTAKIYVKSRLIGDIFLS